MLKRFLIVVVTILVILQFIRPERNLSAAFANDISTRFPVPEEVGQVLSKSCYDCHSNYTDYRWYFNVQPLGLWLQRHVDEGKKHLNFSEFITYSRKKQLHKLEETVEMLTAREMPLPLYEAVHSSARLSDAERVLLVNWANALMDRIEREQPGT